VQDDVDRRLFVVGLGNPGRQYAQTRHNVGFRVVDLLASRWRAGEGKAAFGGQVWEVRPAGPQGASRQVVLFEPHTYMNRSGQAVRELAAFYKAEADEMLVVLDDMNLPVGRVRLRGEGSSGGQKGLADVVGQLGTLAVPRLRIGIGSPPGQMDGADFVLSKFAPEDLEVIETAIQVAADAVNDWVFRGMNYAMETYNRKPRE
jgi:PTH1 family peptidyl-tRNA hydrolase